MNKLVWCTLSATLICGLSSASASATPPGAAVQPSAAAILKFKATTGAGVVEVQTPKGFQLRNGPSVRVEAVVKIPHVDKTLRDGRQVGAEADADRLKRQISSAVNEGIVTRGAKPPEPMYYATKEALLGDTPIHDPTKPLTVVVTPKRSFRSWVTETPTGKFKVKVDGVMLTPKQQANGTNPERIREKITEALAKSAESR